MAILLAWLEMIVLYYKPMAVGSLPQVIPSSLVKLKSEASELEM